jgi:glutamate synthase domain-containing protein 3
VRIDANGMGFQQLNEQIHAALGNGTRDLTLDNVRGQRYIGAGLGTGVRVAVNGVPGNDLGAFMNGAEIVVNANAQDGVANTMNAGKIVIHGNVGDVIGYAMRGGKVFVRGNAGYRVGVHMKSFKKQFPVLIVGGTVNDYAGEYMAGGLLIILGLDRPSESFAAGRYLGTGLHGGTIYLRGAVEPYQVGREVGIQELEDSDWNIMHPTLAEYCHDFNLDMDGFRRDDFVKLTPRTSRPYGNLYAY